MHHVNYEVSAGKVFIVKESNVSNLIQESLSREISVCIYRCGISESSLTIKNLPKEKFLFYMM